MSRSSPLSVSKGGDGCPVRVVGGILSRSTETGSERAARDRTWCSVRDETLLGEETGLSDAGQRLDVLIEHEFLDRLRV